MKKLYFLLVFALFCLGKASFGQLMLPNAFLQGRYVEVGEIGNGAFGTNGAPMPTGYHTHTFGVTWTAVGPLAMVYDYGHDGWSVGTPPLMGDYTYPGFPQEGWSLQINGQYNNAWQAGGFPGTGSLTGTIGSLTSIGGDKRSYWNGTASGGNLKIIQETRVDTLASWIVITTKMYNTSAAPITGVYLNRTCDPDNDITWTGGSFTTTNTIVYQNNIGHNVLVSAVGRTGGYTYMGMGAKDCRAKCYVVQFGLTPTNSISDIWSHTGTAAGYTETLGGVYTNDVGYGICFNVGTINAFDSAAVACAYIFNGNTGIDSAFPDPILNLNGVTISSTYDTFDACAYPLLDSIPITILYGDDKDWTWGKWTWSPGTGLSSTTGTTVTASITSIPGYVTYTVTGVDSNAGMYSCNMKQFIFTLKSCHSAWNNSPCYGDKLQFEMGGDSTGATYYWWNKRGYVSTIHDAFKFPALYTDTGWYFVSKTIAGISDTDSTYVIIHPKPTLIVTDNSPMCSGMIDTLNLSAVPFTAGETFSWSGPAGFTSALEFPSVPGFGLINTGTYTVIATTSFGCKDTGTVGAILIPQPPPPVITVPNYCQGPGTAAITVVATGTVLWYTGPVGGTGTTTTPVISTTVPGTYTIYASQIIGSCESPRASFTFKVTTTPSAPLVAGPMDYCQFVGTFTPLTVTLTKTGKVYWYTVSTGGVPSLTEPVVDITVAGTYSYWVSQIDSGCESPRTPVVINVHAKPAPPRPNPDSTCQYWPTKALSATASGAGDLLKWYLSTSDSTGNVTPPVPSSATPGTQIFYVDETSSFGCKSDRAPSPFKVFPKPRAPLTRDTIYCQGTQGATLTADSSAGSRLHWFILGTPLPMAPTPTNATPGDSTWYVMQTIGFCPSDSTPLTVTTIYKPYFYITAQRPWDCQFDSLWLSYTGPSLNDAAYIWTLPTGAHYSSKGSDLGVSIPTDSMIYVRFDSATQNNYVRLFASDNHGFCSFDTTIRINIIPHPTATSTSKADVCVGDTVSLALSSRSANASIFTWTIDHVPMDNSTAMNILAHNSNSGGPFSISWNDSGRHVIEVRASTQEGCTNPPSVDTIFVHNTPDASFTYTTRTGTPLCLEDSVMFVAKATDYNYSYTWTPAHYFQNINKGVTWGKMEQSKSVVTLLVTDPFGCAATTSQELDPSSCCTVSFPTAFTPNGDHRNDVFRPISAGYHRFHIFRVANRWGQTVYESTNSSMQWDGNYNGVPQDIGVYFYYIKFDCGGNSIEQTGDVTLIR